MIHALGEFLVAHAVLLLPETGAEVEIGLETLPEHERATSVRDTPW